MVVVDDEDNERGVMLNGDECTKGKWVITAMWVGARVDGDANDGGEGCAGVHVVGVMMAVRKMKKPTDKMGQSKRQTEQSGNGKRET